MSVSVPGIISALAMKPMPAMLARSIANNFASLAQEAAMAPTEAQTVTAVEQREATSGASGLDKRA